MSFDLIRHIFDEAPADMSPTCLLVYLALGDAANDDGACWPRLSFLAKRVKLARSTVRAHISTLEDAGYVKRHSERGRSNVYVVRWPSDPFPPEERSSPDSRRSSALARQIPGEVPKPRQIPGEVLEEPPENANLAGNLAIPHRESGAPPPGIWRPPARFPAIEPIREPIKEKIREPRALTLHKMNGNVGTASATPADPADPDPPPLRGAPPVLPELPDSWRGGGWPAAWAYAKSARGRAHLEELERKGRVHRLSYGEYATSSKAIAYREMCHEQGLDCRI